jgi:hypothetical protein
VEHIASLKESLITWGPFGDEIFLISVDGTHCPIHEPRTDPSSKWYSHKFNGPGVSYELALAIHSNRLVWINGPFPASIHDITIFRSAEDPSAGLISMIPEGKRAIGDSGYSGEPMKVAVTRPDDSAKSKKFKARVKSRHENFNGRLKNLRVLSLPFRNGYDRHQEDASDDDETFFLAVCRIRLAIDDTSEDISDQKAADASPKKLSLSALKKKKKDLKKGTS